MSDKPLLKFRKQPGNKWFSAFSRECDDGWFGPHKTIEEAVIECASWSEELNAPIFVGQGHKLNKSEREEVGYEWEVDTRNSIEVRFPATATETKPADS